MPVKVGNTGISSMYVGSTKIAKAYLGDTLVYQNGPAPQPGDAYLTFTSTGTNTLGFTITGSLSPSPVLYYSYDAESWTLWDYSSLSISSGSPVYIYGLNPSGFATSTSNYSRFTMGGTGTIDCSGSIMSLIDGTDSTRTIPTDYCFRAMFQNCKVMRTAPQLPATTLKRYCYQTMFNTCTGLIYPPDLPAMTLAERCYATMFEACSSLTTAPVLPALDLGNNPYCYYRMFRNCSSLNYVKALFTTRNNANQYQQWLYRVASSGTFVKNNAATWSETGESGVPTGWTIQYVTV